MKRIVKQDDMIKLRYYEGKHKSSRQVSFAYCKCVTYFLKNIQDFINLE